MHIFLLLAAVAMAGDPTAKDVNSGGGGLSTGAQPTGAQAEQRFRQELQEQMAKYPPGQIPKDFADKFLASLQDLPPDKRDQYLNEWVQVSDMREAMRELPWGSPERMQMRDQLRAMVNDLRGISPEATQTMFENFGFGRGGWSGGGPGQKPDRGDVDWANHARETFPNSGKIQQGAGDVLRAGGDYQGAAQAYQRAISLNPADTKSLNGLSQIQAEQGDYEHAVENARRALEVNPRDAQAIAMVRLNGSRAAPTAPIETPAKNTGTEFFYAQPAGGDFGRSFAPAKVDQYQGDSRKASALKESLAYSDRADNLLKVRDSAGAKEAALRAIEVSPDNLRAYYALYQANAQRKDFLSALEAVNKGLALEPHNQTLLLAKSNVLSRLGRFEEALSIADGVIADSPSSAPAYFNRAFALAGLGRSVEAVSALERAKGLDARFGALYARASALPPDGDLVALFTGDAPPAKPAPAPKPSRWPFIVGGLAAGALLILFGLSSGSALVTNIGRSLSRAGSASPAVQPMGPVTPAPVDGLAASGIRVERKIGQGGMGIVYEGTDTSLERKVAIKKMREEIRADLRERDRFIKEAKTVAALRHPNIVEIYSIVEDGSDVYLVFEYVTGKTVHDLTYERGALPAGWAISVIKAVASALDYAHKRGVVHRDLKPSNIMVEDDGMVKVMDFGVARMAKDQLARMSMTNTVVGTPPYMAPEQEQGIVRKESDVYALAVCLYEMVTGQLPFQGVGAGMLMAKLNATYVPASRLVQGLPQGFDEVMAQALAADPDKRLRTAGDFAAALSSLPV